ncbi:hypothetical protein HanIR_Chr16g0832591 [Helianthus annuus]|nr:hypothetical protein HanIR_Chr16g0832591 [Helianthus annuus]
MELLLYCLLIKIHYFLKIIHFFVIIFHTNLILLKVGVSKMMVGIYNEINGKRKNMFDLQTFTLKALYLL